MSSPTIYTIRRENLRTLIDESEDKTISAVARLCKTKYNYLSQVLNGYEFEPGKFREIGNALARKIERGCNKPEGWMDTRHGVDLKTLNPEEARLVKEFSKLNEKDQQLVLKTIRFMIDR